MFQVIVQSAMRQLKAKLKLRSPPTKSNEEKIPQGNRDRTGFILALAVGGGILLLAMFSNLPNS
jgi:hypothetical protein